MRRRLTGWVLLGSLVAGSTYATPSYADPKGPNAMGVHVIRVKTEDSDALADALTTALRAEVKSLSGWYLEDGDASLEVLTLALRCPWPPDAACEMRIAKEIKAERYIWGTVDEKNGKAIGTLHFWQRDQGQTKVDVSYAANLVEPNDESLRVVVREMLLSLTGGAPKGSVEVQAGDVNGQIFVDGKAAGAIRDGKATIFVPAGDHSIEVRAPGYAPVAGEVTVVPGQSVAITLDPETAEESTSTPINYRRIGAYSALVAGGALAVAGTYSSLKVRSLDGDEEMETYRKGTDGNICDAADRGHTVSGTSTSRVQDKCSQAKKFQVLQWVFYGLGAASVGVGTYLLATENSSEELGDNAPASKRIKVLPTVMHNGGGVDVRLLF